MKNTTKLPPYVTQARLNSHKAALRKRETWMPGFASFDMHPSKGKGRATKKQRSRSAARTS